MTTKEAAKYLNDKGYRCKTGSGTPTPPPSNSKPVNAAKNGRTN